MARCGCAEACNCVLISGGGVAISGTGTSEDPYVIAYNGPGGSFVQVTDTATVDMSIAGDGSGGNPYIISAVVIPGAVVPQTEATQDIVGAMAGDGLEYDDPAGTIGAKISTDINNNMTIGSDGGLYSGVSAGTVGSQSFVVKTTDTVINNNSVLANDPHLVLPVLGGARYQVELNAIYSSPQVADFKCGWTVPADASLVWATLGPDQGMTNPAASLTDFNIQLEGGVHSIGGPGASAVWVTIRGHLFTAAASGVIQFRWSQNVATVGDTILYDTSNMKLLRVA